MSMIGRRLVLFLMLGCLSPVTWAADDTATSGLWVHEDPSAIAWQPPPGHNSRWRELLNHELRRNPRNVSARIHRAYLLDRAGDHERARRDYDAALEAAPPQSPELRHILWSRGWSRYDMGDLAGALEDWQESVRLHGGRPFWVPYTFALTYWTQGDVEQAMKWYQAAVGASKDWSTEAGMKDRISHWRPEQRERMQALFAFWSAGAGPAVDPAAAAPDHREGG
ncbi:tetratricopeptide repeat protein [Novilysobacter spongiicola]|uniref:Tetratricopeptide repeat-containing protein n=1 Tax=Lysobacter spongiicola DSM 21749 TaxID=1122188 RepID=A0A1T4R710_9GAMM|nr:tetratricopeptide repeat protein [Lysobacter spongiicola]SKA11872.1 Tetratricopeptide repeat-containing protein [Lysobacter spongiicola DSM 21749]